MSVKHYIFLTILLFLPAFAVGAKTVLVIDAGHGGHDAGALGAYSKEKNINLSVALAFGRYVERNCQDVKVVYTRKKDVFVPLHERANIANRAHADMFISIHTNALPGGKVARGMETYTMGMRRSDEKLSAAQRENSVITIEDDYQEHYAGYDPNSPESAIMFEFIHDKNMEQSVELAQLVQKNVCAIASRPNKGVRQDVFLVLRETSMPACLVELGFITTPDEEALLNNEAAVDRIAYGIYTAFVKYKDHNTTTVPPYKAPEQTPPTVPQLVPQQSGQQTRQGRPAEESQPARRDVGSQQTADSERPVFKVQFLTGTRVLRDGAAQFKGLTGVGYYREGSTVKFTVGEYATFAEANARRREIAAQFPDAFVIALRDGKRMDINEARRWRKQ